jgi:hypothetical protein
LNSLTSQKNLESTALYYHPTPSIFRELAFVFYTTNVPEIEIGTMAIFHPTMKLAFDNNASRSAQA